ncbi:hypothetical protein SEPCBS57363_004977 [Sporothrix epigloea]|uniref:Uncharacterized protein n=1 Tax=Sporothrix epigloea TaxID=1892477 RepID=A0ABP0DV72_9PEZI
MPARTHGSTTVTAKGKPFELPALNFKFASLTEGTNIPPPLPSPIAEDPQELASIEKKSSANVVSSFSPSRAATAHGGLKRSADDVPVSPSPSSRPGSIRRLFSRNLLSTAYADAERNDGQLANSSSSTLVPGSLMRPESRSNGSIMDERRARRSSGWFRRLRGENGDGLASSGGSIMNGSAPRSPLSKRTSMLFTNVREQQLPQQQSTKPAGPPPPMIPELSKLRAKMDFSDESLGSDMFKNIK